MGTTPVPNGDVFYVVVADDGSLPAAELARLGVGPGTHVRVVPEQRSTYERVSAFGYLAQLISPEVADALSAGIEQGKADRIEALGRL